jgi:curved DNA-binding protein CbpA
MALELERQVEVETLHGVLGDLDYYRLLKLKGGAPIPEVERAYTEQSQRFHPDRFFGVRDPKLMKKITAIFKKVTEGYQVLKNPELKKMYDEKLGVRRKGSSAVSEAGKRAHVSKATLEQEKAALDADTVVSDKRAKKYWDLAKIAESNQDWNGVVMNIQFAMNYEPDNPLLQQRVEEAKVKMRSKNKKNKNPYKIKIL